MICRELELPGAHLIELEPHRDDRGFFARTWCRRELAEAGLETRVAQRSISYSERRRTLYVLEGFTHGFQTIEDDTEVHYQMSELYSPQHSRGYRPDDPAFGIDWPVEPAVVKDRDLEWSDFDPDRPLGGSDR